MFHSRQQPLGKERRGKLIIKLKLFSLVDIVVIDLIAQRTHWDIIVEDEWDWRGMNLRLCWISTAQLLSLLLFLLKTWTFKRITFDRLGKIFFFISMKWKIEKICFCFERFYADVMLCGQTAKAANREWICYPSKPSTSSIHLSTSCSGRLERKSQVRLGSQKHSRISISSTHKISRIYFIRW